MPHPGLPAPDSTLTSGWHLSIWHRSNCVALMPEGALLAAPSRNRPKALGGRVCSAAGYLRVLQGQQVSWRLYSVESL